MLLCLTKSFKFYTGPKFGIVGIRKLLGVPQAPLLATALKPMGRSSEDFASMAYKLAKGGIDIIKDDHGLSDQKWAPFEERVALCCDAVQRANRETGRNCLYAPCLNAPSDQLISRAYFSKDCGAGAVMLLPGITGFDTVRQLAADPCFNLPILIHPAMLGGWLQSSHRRMDRRGSCNSQEGGESEDEENHPRGLSHKFLFGLLPRLCGGDVVIFCNSGGRFQFTPEECQSVAEGCHRPMGRFEPIFPSPAGGMRLERIKEMRRTFGDDTVFLIGGNLLEQGPDLEADARIFLHAAGRDRPYCLVARELSISSAIAKEDLATSKDMEQPPSHIGESDAIVPSIAHVEHVASNVRRRVLKYTLSNNGGYLSQACSSAETLATLYLRALKLGPSVAAPIPGPFRGSPGPGMDSITGEGFNGDPADLSLDRLIFSPVHYAVVLYSLLVEIGRLDKRAFDDYNVDGSTIELIGAEHSPGHAVTAGSLAQALSQAAGIGYARKLKNATGRVVVFMSDGEFQEGQTWEAVQALVNLKINLVVVVDVNGQQCDGEMKQVCNVGDLARKLRAFGAEAKQVDGHSVADIEMAVRKRSDLPSFVLCSTNPCQGIPLLKDRAPRLHYIRFKNAEEKREFEYVLASMNHKDDSCGDNSSENISTAVKNNISKASFVSRKKSSASETSRGEFSEVVAKVDLVKRPHRENLFEWMKLHPTAIVVTADLTSSCEADLARDRLPEQYLSLGMAEQNMMSFCGGLARENFTPWIHTFGVFCTRRPFDQLAMSVGVPNLNVKILGFLPGLTTPGGVTHQAIDDIALCRSIPNIRVLECGDATEVLSVLDVAQGIKGPVYVRMLRGEVPRLFPSYSPMKFATVRVLSDGNDICLITTGICTEEAIKARGMITSSGVQIRHLHLSTIVPFPVNVVLHAASSTKYGVITMENHLINGGVGSATAEVLAEYAVGKRLIRLGIPNCYAHGASRDYLVSEYGFDKYSLIKAIEELCHRKLTMVDQEKEKPTTDNSLSVSVDRPEDL